VPSIKVIELHTRKNREDKWEVQVGELSSYLYTLYLMNEWEYSHTGVLKIYSLGVQNHIEKNRWAGAEGNSSLQ